MHITIIKDKRSHEFARKQGEQYTGGVRGRKRGKRCNYIVISKKIVSMIKKRNNPPTYAVQSQPKV